MNKVLMQFVLCAAIFVTSIETEAKATTIWEVSQSNDMVELSDGSQWFISWDDRHDVANWHSNDFVYVEQNTAPYAFYFYRLVHSTTLTSAAARFIESTVYSHWIVDVNVIAGTVLLEDGSDWLVPNSDVITLLKWRYDDPIIIGRNGDKSTSHGYSCILINARTEGYVCCVQIG